MTDLARLNATHRDFIERDQSFLSEVTGSLRGGESKLRAVGVFVCSFVSVCVVILAFGAIA